MDAKGKAFRYGNNVDTDVIIPARYLNTTDPKELASHCMEDIDANFVKQVKAGDIMVANHNLGAVQARNMRARDQGAESACDPSSFADLLRNRSTSTRDPRVRRRRTGYKGRDTVVSIFQRDHQERK